MENEIQNITNAEMVPQAPIASESDLELAIKNAERLEELIRKVKIIAIKSTNKNDWVDMGGKPYLQSSGAEKIARQFGISWRICEGYPKKEMTNDEKETFYQYVCKGEFSMGGKTIEVIGTCSQRDKFFGKTKEGFRPLSEIDECSVLKKSITNMRANGITMILGIRNLTWDEINAGGITQSASAAVTYKGTGKEVEGQICNFERRKGKKANGQGWELVTFYINNIKLSTFDTNLGSLAEQLAEGGGNAKATYKSDSKGNTLETLEIVEVETKKEVAK